MTEAGIRISPIYLFLRSAMLVLASLSPVRFEKEADPAFVRKKAEVFFDLFGDAILRLAYSYLHNMADSEEVLQDTLIRYIQTAPKLENEKHAKVWLLRVAANLSKNRIGYNKRRQTDELQETLSAESREDLSFVWDAVKTLKPKQREVIHLFYQEGYSTKEIAQLLERNESSVRSDLKRGRDALQQILKEAYDFA
ncbi:MAG: RNA polymerase sigma factor [Acutalibacteraceae bacterium]